MAQFTYTSGNAHKKYGIVFFMIFHYLQQSQGFKAPRNRSIKEPVPGGMTGSNNKSWYWQTLQRLESWPLQAD